MSNEQAARMAGQWWAERLQQGDKSRFAKEVEDRVLNELRSGKKSVFLQCDYDPQGILLEAVLAIGIKCRGVFFSARGILPEKHSLMVRATELEPKEGYGNWTDKIPVVNESAPKGGGGR
jgi:hypothetical protein